MPDLAPTRRATIYDVAREAGVSHQTVSRIVKGESNVRPDLRARIEKALSDLDYHPNEAARTLTTRRSRVIAAIVHDISEIGPSLIVQGASERAREAGYFLEIVTVDSDDAPGTESSIDILKHRGFAGVLAVSPSDEIASPITTDRLGVPVHIAHEADDDGDQSVNKLGMTMLVDHLADLGHTQFRMVCGPVGESAPARNRAAAYAAALTVRGLTSVGMSAGDWSAASAYDAIRSLDAIDFTALVAANDQMALGAMLAITERGLEIPADVSVVGFDDIAEARFFQPPLTTIAQDMRLQGQLAMDALLSAIRGQSADVARDRVRPRLRARQSSGPASTDVRRD